jgi:predicted nucleic acid-binding protein
LAESIDIRKLPNVVMFDTTCLVAASGGATRPDQAGACGPLFDAIIEAGRTLLVAAPTFAEFLRKRKAKPIPHLAHIEVVPFDRMAAQVLAERFPKEALTRYRDQSSKGSPPIDYIKYDAMIVACGVRHKADVFVSLDDDQRKMAVAVGLKVASPRDYMGRQQELAGIEP